MGLLTDYQFRYGVLMALASPFLGSKDLENLQGMFSLYSWEHIEKSILVAEIKQVKKPLFYAQDFRSIDHLL